MSLIAIIVEKKKARPMNTKEETFVDWAKFNAIHNADFVNGKSLREDCPEILIMSTKVMSPYRAEGFLNGLPFVLQSNNGKTKLVVGKLNTLNALRDPLYVLEVESIIDNNKDFAKVLPLMVLGLEKA